MLSSSVTSQARTPGTIAEIGSERPVAVFQTTPRCVLGSAVTKLPSLSPTKSMPSNVLKAMLQRGASPKAPWLCAMHVTQSELLCVKLRTKRSWDKSHNRTNGSRPAATSCECRCVQLMRNAASSLFGMAWKAHAKVA
eukprot:CAMPEP_0117588504 /NCGR_PEP_ID=MMETSP0784-20121206/69888_1 /TAXON_ID=39447 /ORGANISM="" /LENGTH=137 /DNA_ID=CAMNT_0005389871 /DNA_START=100 /DNA_END=510 /DNA_ORIENTATION=-